MAGVTVSELAGVVDVVVARAGTSMTSENHLHFSRGTGNGGGPVVRVMTNADWSRSARWYTLDTMEELAASLLVMIQQMKEGER